MNDKTILTCAVTGNLTTREQHPGLPITPEEIANAAVAANRAGAAIVHLHVRDPKTEKGTMELALYTEVVERIRAADCDVVINLTTGEGGRYKPDDNEPRVAGEGTTLCAPELRVAHVKALQPEICTLDFNTLSTGDKVVMNTPRNLEIMANIINEAGTRPEAEIFDSGDLVLAKDFIKRGLLKEPVMMQLVLGVRFGAPANYQTLAYLVSQLPENCIWGAFGIGRFAFPMLALSYLFGGHVRVGMEDSAFIEKGQLTPDNAALVTKGVGIVKSLGGTIATPADAREILGL